MSKWVMQEPGWWTRDAVGGVCRARGKEWYAYPSGTDEVLSGYRTMQEAMEALDARSEEKKP